MQYMNIVRMRVKSDRIDDYIQALKTQPSWEGQLETRTIRFGDNGFCGYGLWESQEAMMAQMDNMVSWLDTVRPMLEELSAELGVTDAISGPVV
jgi:hypothetical protein